MPLHMHAAMFSIGFDDGARRNTVSNINEPLLKLVSGVIRFFVMSGSV